MKLKSRITAALGFLIDLFGGESPSRIREELALIKDNHLFHLQLSVNDNTRRIGSLEGKMWVLLTVSFIILTSVLAPIAVDWYTTR